ncbi:hypothetical protein LRZ95_01450 [Candidatus Gracilibacteria bacterium]|nr:hypothetical protein [Candidatus Gracilibacteria bacterium]
MLYLFTGNTDYLVKQKVSDWKNKFISKFGEFNLIHIKDIENTDNNFLAENINSTSFLGEKKLIVIDLNEKLNEDKQNFLLKILKNIPDTNIILFNSINSDKRSKIYKYLKENANIKEFNTKNDSDIYSIIKNKYSNTISTDGINTIIKYKSGNLNKIISEIDKLLINYEKIDKEIIEKHITPELEESIFQIIDEILNKNTNTALKKIDIILNDTNIYSFYNNLLANLRTSIYIYKLKKLNKSSNEIISILNLGNRGFLINKKYKLNFNELKNIYINLIHIDKKMKSGKLNGTEEKDFKFELEKILIKG